MASQRSIVKWFDAKKGYGFLVHPGGGQDIFVHYSQIDTEKRFRTLRTGQEVEFQLQDGPKGLHAQNVVPLDFEAEPGSDGYGEPGYVVPDYVGTAESSSVPGQSGNGL